MAASCSWPRSSTWYFPPNPNARQRYCSSIRSRYRAGSGEMRSSISKNFSPPHASRCRVTSSGCCAHSLCAPHGVDSTASSRCGAQDVARGDDDLVRHARRPRACSSKRRISSSAWRRKPVDIHRGHGRRAAGPPSSSSGLAALHQRVQPDTEQLAGVFGNRLGFGRLRRGPQAVARPAAPSPARARPRPEPGRVRRR